MKYFFLFFCVSAYAVSPVSNPAVSANALMLYQNSSLNGENQSTERNGLQLQELELSFGADVDPYTHLKIILTVFPEYTADPVYDRVEEEWVIEPEEAYVESLSIPSVTLKVGRFKAALGKHNLLHTHAFPFNDAPLANKGLLGDEGLNDVGVSAAALLPTPWFSELTLQYLRGQGENEEFNSASPSDGVGLLHWKNLVDIDEGTTVELGGSGAQGPNDLGGNTTLLGVDLTFKWRPVAMGRYRSAVVSLECLDRRMEQKNLDDDHKQGFNIWSAYQWAERWYTGLRWDNLESTERWTGNLEFRATEFSSFRLEYSHAHNMDTAAGEIKDENKISLQGNFTIGAHPAHAY